MLVGSIGREEDMPRSIHVFSTGLAAAVMVFGSAGAAAAKCADCSSGSGGGGIGIPPYCMWKNNCR